MKLFIVIYLGGLIGGTVGPLPYGVDECRRRVAEKMDSVREDVMTPQGFTKRDVHFECEWHQERPANHPDAGKRL